MPRPVVPVDPPDRSTWSRVLRRYDRDPRLPWRVTSYDVNVEAQPVSLNGRIAPTIFVPHGREAAAHRATRLGWIDETEAWDRAMSQSAPVEAAPEPLVGDALREHLQGMRWHTLLSLAAGMVPGKVHTSSGRSGVIEQVLEVVTARGQGLVV